MGVLPSPFQMPAAAAAAAAAGVAKQASLQQRRGWSTSLNGGEGEAQRRRQRQEELEEAELQAFARELAAAQKVAREAEAAAAAEAEGRRLASEDGVRLLDMYINRGNSCWAAQREWAMPTLLDRQEQDAWMDTGDWGVWKAKFIGDLREGHLAIQIMAFDEPLQFPDGPSFDIWTCDPWELAHCKQPFTAPREHMPGIPLGCRVLMNLSNSVEALGGKSASANLIVILHLADHQVELALEQIYSFKCCGLQPGNIWILVQRRCHGYRYNGEQQRFEKAEDSPLHSPGSGLATMQLNFPGDSMCLDAEGGLQRMSGTVLENLESLGVQWVLAQQGADMGLLAPGSCLDIALLPLTMAAHKAGVANCAVQAYRGNSLGPTVLSAGGTSCGGSVVLGQAGKPGMVRSSSGGSASSSALMGLAPVAELRGAELQAGAMKDVLKGGKLGGMDYLMGLDRYTFHISILQDLLTSPKVFRPKLTMDKDCVYVSMNSGDMLSAESSNALCFAARQAPKVLVSPEDCKDLIPVLRSQDENAAFRKLAVERCLSMFRPQGGPSGPGGASSRSGGGGRNSGQSLTGMQSRQEQLAFAGIVTGDSEQSLPNRRSILQPSTPESSAPRRHMGRQVIVFVTSNVVCASAVNAAIQLSKPGCDVIHLATVVAGPSYVDFGYGLLQQYCVQAARALVEVRQKVLVMEGEGSQMISTMDEFVQSVKADLVVMASHALSSQVLNTSAVLSSVTLAAVKRISVPIVIINPNCANAMSGVKQLPIKAMIVAQRNCNELAQYMCDKILEPKRGDTLLLGQVQLMQSSSMGGFLDAARDQQQLNISRTQACLAQMATFRGLPLPQLVSMESDRLPDLLTAIVEEDVKLLGFPLPAHTASNIPEQLVHLIHSSRCAVLVYRNQPTK